MSDQNNQPASGLRRKLKVSDLWRRFTGSSFPINPTVEDMGKEIFQFATNLFGEDFINPSEVIYDYNEEQLFKLYQHFLVFCDLATLPMENAFLVPGPPINLTFADMMEEPIYCFTDQTVQLARDGDQSNIDYLLNMEDVPGCNWLVFLKSGFPDSDGKMLERQLEAAGKQDRFRPATAVEAYYCLWQYLKVRGINLLKQNIRLRTSSVSSNDQNVVVKLHGGDGFMITDWRENKEMCEGLFMSGVWVYDPP
tara:strand:+ start:13917 stop:14672 length:756 start_codon:yes stop_codon:yes gene_type:complete